MWWDLILTNSLVIQMLHFFDLLALGYYILHLIFGFSPRLRVSIGNQYLIQVTWFHWWPS